MSVKAMAWAFEQTLRGNDKSVLLAIANFADEKGYCWPSHAVVAQHAGCSKATVKRSIQRLEARGYICKDARTRPGRGQSSNAYTLALSVLVFKVEPSTQDVDPVAQFEPSAFAMPVAQFDPTPVAHSDTPGSSPCTPPVAHGEPPTTLNRHLEPPMNQGASARTTAAPLWNQGKHVVPLTERVWMVGETLHVSDAYRAEWVDRVGGAQIFDLTLIEIAGSIQPNALKSTEVQVSRHLSIIARRQIEQDRRYAAAAKASKAKPDTAIAAPPPASLGKLTSAEWEARIAIHAGKVWGDELGPPPGDPKCLVPPAIVKAFGLAEKYDHRGIIRTGWKRASAEKRAHA